MVSRLWVDVRRKIVPAKKVLIAINAVAAVPCDHVVFAYRKM
jgi:hypothetical protein